MFYIAIDLGSNSFQITIKKLVDGLIKTVFTKNIKTHLAKNLAKTKNIDSDSIDISMENLENFFYTTKKYKPNKIHIIATQAIREAKNANKFTTKVESLFNEKVNIISGEEEASLIYLAVKKHLNNNSKVLKNPTKTTPILVMDIGGASTEIAQSYENKSKNTNNDNISYRVGVVGVAEKYFSTSAYSQNKINFLLAYDFISNEVLKKETPNKEYIVAKNYSYYGTSGAIGSIIKLKDIFITSKESSKKNTSIIYKNDLLQIKKEIIKNGYENIELDDLPKHLNKLIPAGVSILESIMDFLEIEQLEFISASICDGIIAKYLLPATAQDK